MKKNLSTQAICWLLVAASWAGCEESISMDSGKLPDKTTMDNTAGVLRSTSTLTNKVPVNLAEGDQTATQEIFYWLSRPATSAVTVTAVADETLVKDYNRVNNTQLDALPAANVQFEGGGALTIASGKQESGKVKFTISTAGLKSGTPYLLPVTVTQAPAKANAQAEKQILYYGINIRKIPTTVITVPGYPEMDMPPLMTDFLSVFYVNTRTYQPLLISVFYLEQMDMIDFTMTNWTIGNIVNLKTVTVGYDPASKRALLSLDKDMSYVLEHADKYIRPLQDYGRKVCLCIEGGNQGMGFCNMNDDQIADFTQQVKEAVALYRLDGVNLWDEGSGYGKDGMPAVNTTSYPKLIKALREALPGKLLTLVDKDEPTASFHDVALCGGIEVGKFIDYAWHGYATINERGHIIEPWASDQPYSSHIRKPIAGLTPERYGSVNYPFALDGYAHITDETLVQTMSWRLENRKKNNIIVFGNDALGCVQNVSQSGMNDYIVMAFNAVADGGLDQTFYMVNFLNYLYNATYKVYAKDW